MFNTLKIEGFRTFEELTISGLGRINLLVGANNSGKTSVLEALAILLSRGDQEVIRKLLQNRQEIIHYDENGALADYSSLFWGYSIKNGKKFAIELDGAALNRLLSVEVGQDNPGSLKLSIGIGEEPSPFAYSILLTSDRGQWGVIYGDFALAKQLSSEISAYTGDLNMVYLTTRSLIGQPELLKQWEQIVLTENEDRVTNAIKIIVKDAERIAWSTTSETFIVRLKGAEKPVTIGSFGDGLWRIMYIALALIRCQGGVLLIDEIDTGLHYSILADLWKMIYEMAKALDVQVFATTHSSDCYRSLSAICTEEGHEADPVALHRINAGRKQAVTYTEAEIIAVAEHGMEAR
jgi:predicted ATPase